MKKGFDGSVGSCDFQTGDDVYSATHGFGEVCSIDSAGAYPVRVAFGERTTRMFSEYAVDGQGRDGDSIILEGSDGSEGSQYPLTPLDNCRFKRGDSVFSTNCGKGVIVEVELIDGVLVEFDDGFTRRYRLNGCSFSSHDNDLISQVSVTTVKDPVTMDDILKWCADLSPGDVDAFRVWLNERKKSLTVEQVRSLITAECSEIAKMLIDKNRKYGNSVFSPLKVFSKLDPEERIKVRLDDKISRIVSGQEDEDEDVDLDIIGYLILKRIKKLAVLAVP